MCSIHFENGVFHLTTENTSYLFKVNSHGHLEHIHYGKRVEISDAFALSLKRTTVFGDAILYDREDENYCLDDVPLEYATFSNGDFREPSIITDITDLDLQYVSHSIISGNPDFNGLPSSYGADNTLVIHTEDKRNGILLNLYYSVYPKEDVITRSVSLTAKRSVIIRKIMSASFDMIEEDMEILDFNGCWANEVHETFKSVVPGTFITSSRVGFSSSRVNPGTILKRKHTDDSQGEAYGFNLVYSGNHYTSFSCNDHLNIRYNSGIGFENFNYSLAENEVFHTPEAVMTFSDKGMNDLSDHFHRFIKEHIVRGPYSKAERPTLINSWEAFGFDYDHSRLLGLAKEAKELGIELFVLDDGWFSSRNSDRSGLGDYWVNKTKLPHGIRGLSDEIHEMGMKFGIWVEPESVNIDSDLYRLHPEWTIPTPLGRNELALDLSRKDVQDYIVNNVSEVLDQGVDYVKWDMNRQLCNVSGDYDFRYLLGLYSVLHRIFDDRHILFESCSSGGNRFDLGMLCFSPQIWASDNTDPIERIRIQRSLSYFYPLSTMGSHVSQSPSSQTLRHTPLHTRFAVSCFGDLGYELDLSLLSEFEKAEIRNQIIFYKRNRIVFQSGTFRRIKNGFCAGDDDMLALIYRGQTHTSPEAEKLRIPSLPKGTYRVEVVPFNLDIRDFGYLGSRFLDKDDSNALCITYKDESFVCSAEALSAGVPLNNVFTARKFNHQTRLPLDNGCEIYSIKKIG